MSALRFGFRRQLLAVAVLLFLPAPIMMQAFLTTTSEQIESSSLERAGVSYLEPMYELLVRVEEARIHKIERLGEQVDPAVLQRVREAVAAIDLVDARLGARLGVADEWADVRTVALDLTEDRPNASTQFLAWEELGVAVLDLFESVGARSNLILDPELDSYWLMDATVFRLPEVIVRLHDGIAAHAWEASFIRPVDVGQVAVAVGAMTSVHETFESGIRTSFEASEADLESSVGPLLEQANVALLGAEDEILAAVDSTDAPAEDLVAIHAAADEAIAVVGALQSVALAELDGLLAVRIARMESAQIRAVVSVVVAGVFGVLALVWFFGRSSRTLRKLTAASKALAQSSTTLDRVSSEMSAAATTASSLTGSAVASVTSVDEFTQSVATANEQVRVSIAEIAQSAQHATTVSSRAVEVAVDADEAVTELSESSQGISTVVELIASIAEETNLLALNATIEAARAGELGRGFAVVANEVKELALGTSRATSDISARVVAIQDSVARAQRAIGDITEIVRDIESSQVSIAHAVEEQNSVTASMADSMTDLAEGSHRISADIRGVAGAVDGASSNATSTSVASSDLSQLADELDALVGLLR